MNWFERHLNWTLVLLCYVGSFVALGAGYAVALIFAGGTEYAGFVMALIGYPMFLAVYIGVARWYLKKKGLSYWHLAWLAPPIVGICMSIMDFPSYLIVPVFFVGYIFLLTLNNVGEASNRDKSTVNGGVRYEELQEQGWINKQRLVQTTDQVQEMNNATEYDIRQQCLAYYQEELNFKAFQEKEADLYNEAVVKYGMSVGTDDRAAKEMLRATKRLVESANEILRRRSQMAGVPDMASATYFAWQTTYSDYLAWASAQAAAVSAVAKGMVPHGKRVQELLEESEKSRRRAEGKEKRFLKQLMITGDEVRRMLTEASTVVGSQNCQAEEVSKGNTEAELVEEYSEVVGGPHNIVHTENGETMDKAKVRAILGRNKVIVALGKNIVASAFLSAGLVNDAWTRLTGEAPTIKSDFIVRSEMLWFFLHVMDRYSFHTSGPEVRDILQDAIVENAIETMLTTSFDTTHAERGFDSEEWMSRMASNGLEEFNEAGLDYSSCTRSGMESSGDFFDREETILGKLATRIGRLTGQELNLDLRILIQETVLKCLAESKLKEQTKKACGVLK